MENNYESNPSSIWRYLSGFGLSLVLTLMAYFLVQRHISSGHTSPSDNWAMAILAVLAVIQLFVQLVFFLHLGRDRKNRWNLVALAFAAIVVFILVAGSLWIMHHLNYSMNSQQMSQYLKDQESGGI